MLEKVRKNELKYYKDTNHIMQIWKSKNLEIVQSVLNRSVH